MRKEKLLNILCMTHTDRNVLKDVKEITRNRKPKVQNMWYSRIASTKSPSFCMTNFCASLTNLMVLPQSHDYSYCVSRQILAPPLLWLQKHTDLRACDFAHSLDLWHQPLANVTCAWRWRFLELLLLYMTQEGLRLCLTNCDTMLAYTADHTVSHFIRLLTCIVALLLTVQWV
jgi:hypothetical protein